MKGTWTPTLPSPCNDPIFLSIQQRMQKHIPQIHASTSCVWPQFCAVLACGSYYTSFLWACLSVAKLPLGLPQPHSTAASITASSGHSNAAASSPSGAPDLRDAPENSWRRARRASRVRAPMSRRRNSKVLQRPSSAHRAAKGANSAIFNGELFSPLSLLCAQSRLVHGVP